MNGKTKEGGSKKEKKNAGKASTWRRVGEGTGVRLHERKHRTFVVRWWGREGRREEKIGGGETSARRYGKANRHRKRQ